MKFICLGYFDEQRWNQYSEEKQQALMEECMAYDDELRSGKHFIGGEALGSATDAVTLRPGSSGVDIVDGPFSETKEVLGGILLLEAHDLNHAIDLMSRHPGVAMGGFEIRAADETVNEMVAERARKFEQSNQ